MCITRILHAWGCCNSSVSLSNISISTKTRVESEAPPHLTPSDHVYFRWSRSIYRSTIGRYIGRLSTDISVDCRSSIGRLSVDYRSTIGRLSVDYRSTIGRLSVDIRPIFDRYSTDIAVDSRPTDMSTDIVLVHRYSTDT